MSRSVYFLVISTPLFLRIGYSQSLVALGDILTEEVNLYWTIDHQYSLHARFTYQLDCVILIGSCVVRYYGKDTGYNA